MTIKNEELQNVCSVIARNDLCAGCGVCAGVCGNISRALAMEWNEYGEYVPIEVSGKCTGCGSCLASCPFWNQEENETTLAQRAFSHQENLMHHPVVGFYLDLYSGYSNIDDHRMSGSGGGLGTWFLEQLLTRGIVDKVCCVLPNDDPAKLFTYSMVDNVMMLRQASRSKYYPVEISHILSEIYASDHKYAVVGLPCVLKGLRLAMRQDERLRERISCLVGLVCGQQKSKYFAEYLCAMRGGQPRNLATVTFRVKDEARSHLDHRYEFVCNGENKVKKGNVYQSEGMGRVWGYDYFKLNSCNYCDDICAEVADVSFGDAVADRYSYGNRGGNFVIARNQIAIDILEEGAKAAEIILERIPIDAIVERQRGTIINKRYDLSHRLYGDVKNRGKQYIPMKRVTPKRRINLIRNLDMAARDRMRSLLRL
jgi:coenzyme F420 hydrogenase subunit beta